MPFSKETKWPNWLKKQKEKLNRLIHKNVIQKVTECQLKQREDCFMVAFFLKTATHCAPEDSVKFCRIENPNGQWLKQVLSLMKKQSRCGSTGNLV